MPPSRRERHNAKARRSVVGGTSHKHKKVKKRKPSNENPDVNAEVLDHKSIEDKEASRRERLRQELLLENQSASSKKKKRLEKYIDKQLQKEERVEILQRLAETQRTVTSTLQLHSSAALGTGRLQTAEERFEKEEHIAVKKTLLGKGKRRDHQRRNFFDSNVSDSEDQGDSGDSEDEAPNDDPPPGTSRIKPITIQSEGPKTLTSEQPDLSAVPGIVNTVTAGSALKKSVDGAVTTPKWVKRKTKGVNSKFASWKKTPIPQETAESDSSSDFDSSESENDSAEDEEEDEWEGVQQEENLNATPEVIQKPAPPRGEKRSFKDWAAEQLKATNGLTNSSQGPETIQTNIEAIAEAQALLPPAAKKRKFDDNAPRGPMGSRLEFVQTPFAKAVQKERANKSDDTAGKRNVIKVDRTEEVRAQRILLPIIAEEQQILEAILLHLVVVICGETGSGKTTQVPQFLYEAGFGSAGSDNPGMIGITQPRRVAAVAMASRVAHELNLPSTVVSYKIRYDSTTGTSSSIKFMTDGVLLREMATDFLLSQYSIVIVDEAHERNLNTDILIGTLSRVVKLRDEMWREGKSGVKPLRLVIMSATLRIADFVDNKTLFDTPPPVIKIDARQHPVTIHFDRRTRVDYVTQAINKAVKIHTRLPAGGILIFLTGQQEILGVCKRLGKRFGRKAIEDKKATRLKPAQYNTIADLFSDGVESISPRLLSNEQRDLEAEDIELGGFQEEFEDQEVSNNDAEALDTESEEDTADNDLSNLPEDTFEVPMHIVPLYSLLVGNKQIAAFEPPPEGSRLVVVATNVAETSLTIPNIKYVIDSGRVKERQYDILSGVQSFQVSWISKASAAQRAGRAGRTGPGHCYRLYSSSLYEYYFSEHSTPEIMRTPIEGVVLQMKNMHIDAVVNFPFPTPPDRLALKKAELVLTRLGAVEMDQSKGGQPRASITALGRTMSRFPVIPRYGKMLANGMQHGCLPYIVAIVAGLTVGDPFIREDGIEVVKDNDNEPEEEEENSGFISQLTSEEVKAREKRKALRKAFFQVQRVHSQLGNGQSDVFKLLSVIGAYEYSGGSSAFCQQQFLRAKAMEEIHKLRSQISAIISNEFPGVDACFSPKLTPPTLLQIKALRQILAAGFIDQIAARKDAIDKASASGAKYASARGIPYRAVDIQEDVYIHPSSLLFHQSPPDYVAFQEVVRGSKVWIKTLTVVNPAWLAQLGPALCTFSKPLSVPQSVAELKQGEVLVIPKFGPGWELPPMRKKLASV